MSVDTKKMLVPSKPSMPLPTRTEKECIALGLPSTSKAKARIGCPDDWEITWTQFGLDVVDSNNLKALARKYDVPVAEMCARVMVQWFEQNRDAIYAEAEAFVQEDKTDADIDKLIAAEMRKLERLQAEAAARKAKAAK